jgi:hypothetical protein
MRWQRAIAVFALGLLLAGALAATAEARNARCLVRGNGVAEYHGACEFLSDPSDPSFALSPLPRGRLFPGDIEVISVEVSGREAEVRGLTSQGINSRWGPATRSKRDGACWQGEDFLVCAW